MRLLGQPDNKGWREVIGKTHKSEYLISRSETNSKSEFLNVQNKDRQTTLMFLGFDH